MTNSKENENFKLCINHGVREESRFYYFKIERKYPGNAFIARQCKFFFI